MINGASDRVYELRDDRTQRARFCEEKNMVRRYVEAPFSGGQAEGCSQSTPGLNGCECERSCQTQVSWDLLDPDRSFQAGTNLEMMPDMRPARSGARMI